MEDIRNEKLQPEAQGLASSCPLCEIEDLFVRDRENPAMPLLTRRGIQLSARLVNDTYALQLSPWQEAGWRDVHVEIDDLMTRPMQGEEKGRGLEDLQLRLARDRLEKTGAVRSITGTLRQAGEADTCKAVVMARVADSAMFKTLLERMISLMIVILDLKDKESTMKL